MFLSLQQKVQSIPSNIRPFSNTCFSKVILVFTFSLSIISVKAIGQIDTAANTFAAPVFSPKFSDSLLALDAFVITNYVEINNVVKLENGQKGAIEKQYRRIKINSGTAIKSSSTITLSYENGANLTTLIARRFTTTGKVISYSNLEIVPIHYGVGEVKYFISGVEVGDELEYLAVIEYETIIESRVMYLHTNFPCLKSRFRYNCSKYTPTQFRARGKNDTIYHAFVGEYYDWRLSNLPGMGDSYAGVKSELYEAVQFNMFHQQIMLRDEINFTSGTFSNSWWGLWAGSLINCRNVRLEQSYKFQSIVGYMMRWNETHANFSPDQKLLWLQHFINDSLEVVTFSGDDANASLMFYILNRKIDVKNLHNFIRRFLEETNLNYYVCISSDRMNGPIDLFGAAEAMIDEMYYCILFPNRERHYLFLPSNGRKYHIDEVPTKINASTTQWIRRGGWNREDSVRIPLRSSRLSGELDKDTIVETSYAITTLLPKNPFSENIRSCTNVLSLDLLSGNGKFILKEKLQADFSTMLREENPEALLKKYKSIETGAYESEKPKIWVDSVAIVTHNEFYPFEFATKCKGIVTAVARPIGESRYSIPLAGLINHYILQTSDEYRTLNYYAPFAYTDIQKLYLQFDGPVEIKELDLSTFRVEKEFASFEIKLNQVNEKVIVVESIIELRKNPLNPAEVLQLDRMNKNIKQSQELNLFVKKL